MRRNRRTTVLLLALALASTAACGSTVQGAGTTATGGLAAGGGLAPAQAGDGLTAPGEVPAETGGLAAPGGAAVGSGSTPAGGTTATAPGGSGAQAVPGSPTGAGPVPGSAKGRGWDEKVVWVGVLTQKDTEAVFSRFGADDIDPGDTEAQATAVVKDLNAKGGILGRQVKLRFFDVSIVEAQQNPSAVGERACSFFTQDAPVMAVWNISTQVDQAPTLRGCLAQARVPLFTAASRAIVDDQLRKLSPYYWHTVMVSWDQVAPLLVSRLKAQGWFGGWDSTLGAPATTRARVGILIQGNPEGQRAAAVLKQQLSRVGYTDTEVYEYVDAAQGQTSSVNYFKGKGVTHVIVTDVEMAAFQISAENQRYRPRYGLTTYNAPYGLQMNNLSPKAANVGAMGIGWTPKLDVSDANEPAGTSGTTSCRALMKAAGQELAGKPLAATYSFSLCDALRLIARGAQAGGDLTATAIHRGILSTSKDFAPANGFSTALRGERLYVQGSARDLVWNTECSCMRYGSTTTPFG